ncbi:hypothetical protein CAter282_0353 [Collimonas arenae]|uniref:Uncharacterized protein n=1 Tax=Collimonas arenae TaxID=279058 RepID=A0A127PKG3_9BURK|nr:hypothetical protein CAter10_0374 [Collimonas arenae]AMP08171.1 hypothetical protein CAter282_0353 [Collimonas arenae]
MTVSDILGEWSVEQVQGRAFSRSSNLPGFNSIWRSSIAGSACNIVADSASEYLNPFSTNIFAEK